MPTFTPIDHDPFAGDAAAPAAPSSAPLISFSDAPSGGGGGPVFVPVDRDPFADDASAPSPDAPRPLTIRGGRQAPATLATMDTPIGGSAAILPAGLSSSSARPPAAPPAPDTTSDATPDADVPPGSLSYDQAFPSPTPHPGGILSNSQDDGYLSGAAKGAATAAIKGAGDSVGAVGGLSNLADYLIARAEAKITGKPVDQVMAEHAATRQRVQADMSQDPIGKLAVATDPTNVLPAPSDVSGPLLARAGEYVPTTEAGKVAQSGLEAAVGAFGPGGGAISPGTAGKAVVSTLARQAPTMAAAGAIGQGVTDYTGDPLLGLGAGLIGAPIAETGLSKAGSALAPVVGGSKLLNATPIIGPAIRNARGNEVARTILGQADDPAAVRAAANAPAPDPAVPNSPQTFAGQIGNDQGLFEAEKALRNTKAEKVVDPATGQSDQGPTYFNAVDRGQSAAQVSALQGLQPTGDVMRPGQMLSQRMDAINGAAENAIDRLTAAHEDAVAGRASSGQAFADGMQSDLAARQADRTQAGADFIGQQRADLTDRTVDRGQASGDVKAAGDAAQQAAHDALAQRLSDAYAGQQGQATAAAAPLAGGPVDMSDLGATLRNSVEAIRADTKGLHRNLYNQVDPNNSLALVATPIGDRASTIATDLTSKGGEMSGAEAGLFNRAAALPDVASYGMVHQLDTDLSAAISTERRASGESPTWARLTQLKGAVKSAITNATDNHAAWEQRQVAAGAMAPEDTIAARLGGFFGAGKDDWNAAGQQLQARQRTGTGDLGYSDPGAVGFSGAYGTEGQGVGGSRSVARDPGLSSPRGGASSPQGVAAPAPSSIADDVAWQAAAAGRPVDEARAAGALQDAYYRTRAARFGGARGTAEDLYRSEAPTIGGMRDDGDFVDDRGTGQGSLAEQMNARLGAAQDAAPARPALPAPLNPAVHPELIEAGNHVIHRVLVGDDTRFYRAYQRPAGGLDGVTPDKLGDRIGSVALGRHPDGRWEVGNVTVPEAYRRQGIASTMYGAIEKDLGIKMQPSGQLRPDGYAMWLARDPEAVKWHREVDGAYWSPKALKSAYESPDIGRVAQATRAAYDALPPEAKTPEALRSMFQDGTDGPRGQIRFAPGERPQIGVGRGADASTIPHEMSHAWFEDLIADAKHPAAPTDLKADARTLLDHVGSTDGTLNAAQHERLAQGLEQYLRDGKAPTPALARVFGQFKDWLGRIYQTMRGSGAPVGDDVRGVYGRMLDGGSSPREVGTGPRPDAPAYDPDGMRAPQRPDVPRPQDLRAFVKSRGGMIDTGGDLASMGLHELIGRGARAVDPDKMREAAAEAGYLGADTARAMRETHPNDLLDVLSGDRPVHSVRDEDAAAAWEAYDEARERYDATRGEFGTRSRFGVVPERAPLSAYSRDDIEGPNGPQAREPVTSGLAPTFDKAAEGRLREANAAYAQYARTYKNPVIGPALRTTGYAGQYARNDAAFIKGAIKPGAEGYEHARAFLAAAKNDPDAVAAMHDAALNPLRKAVTGNGTLPIRELDKWKSADGYGPALRALDEVTPGFSSRFDNAGKASQALLDLGRAHKVQIEAARDEAARQAIIDNLQRKDALRQATSEDKATVARLIAERKASDRTEGQADRSGVASAIADRSASDKAANAQSRAGMEAGKAAANNILVKAKASPAAQFAKATGDKIAPTEVENTVGNMLKTGTGGATRMQSLVQSVSSDPEALAGLRKAATNWIVDEHMNTDGTLSAAKLISFLQDNRDTIAKLFPHEQRSMFGAIARDAEAGMRWRTSTAIKGGSDSVKNLLASLDKAAPAHAGHLTVGMVAFNMLEAARELHEHAGWWGVTTGTAAAGLGYLGNTLRQSGIRNTANLYREAMANPELARALISKMPAAADGNALHNLARVLKRGLIVGPTLARQANGGSK